MTGNNYFQRESVEQNVQTEEEHPRGYTPVRPDATCGGHAGLGQPATGRHAARGGGPQRMGRRQ